ncbi:uncharacterized protein B0H64DRAFT_375807 [Chaetomium fimeti]|uniref:Uncharacterized protein n=1 Tax=Chaetomium fimeti TaxID=1854472 RepID=A0AAE0LRT1_9PEZI|nr:hypothetical protein B0H64DRAFT_375807 [Chaetomium fimeti]
MHFFGALSTLVAAGLVAAAPTAPESYIDVRAEDDYFWAVSGWGNPTCEGSLLWSYQGTGSSCINVRTFAASASYIVNHESQLELINVAECGFSGLAKTDNQPNITTGCVTAPVMSFRIFRRY